MRSIIAAIGAEPKRRFTYDELTAIAYDGAVDALPPSRRPSACVGEARLAFFQNPTFRTSCRARSTISSATPMAAFLRSGSCSPSGRHVSSTRRTNGTCTLGSRSGKSAVSPRRSSSMKRRSSRSSASQSSLNLLSISSSFSLIFRAKARLLFVNPMMWYRAAYCI